MERRQGQRAVLYARKSTKDDRSEERSASVADQLRRCRAYAEERGWRVVAENEDDGRSGLLDRGKRPGLDATLRTIESGDADVLVTLWTSRLSREERQRAEYLAVLDLVRAQWHAVEDGGLIDRSTYSGYIQYGVNTLFDVAYSKRVGENWRAAQAKRLERGEPVSGQPRFGYVKDDEGRFVPDPVTGPILRDLYLRYGSRAGFTRLTADLNERGVLTITGKPFSVRTLSRLLDSGFGAGLIVRDRGAEFVQGAHEPVITAAQWQRYQRVRDELRQEPARRKSPRWFLSGVVRCGLCGSSVYVNSYSLESSQINCSRARATGGTECSGRMRMKREWIEYMVLTWLAEHFEDFIAGLPERSHERASLESAAVDAEEALTQAEAALTRLAVSHAKGIIDEPSYLAAKRTLDDERAAAVTARDTAQAEVDRVQPVADTEYQRLQERGADLTPGEWGHAAGRILREVQVHKRHLTFVPVIGDPEDRPRP